MNTSSRQHRPSGIPVALFDLDGTLIDTARDVGDALNPILRQHDLPELDPVQSAALMGNGLRRFAQGAFAAHGREADDAVIEAFIARYAEKPVTHTRPYAGVTDTLPLLAERGWTLVVCTNKVERLATAILDQLDLLAPFVAVCGSDRVPAKKPDPRHLQAALERADLAHSPAVMIGDYSADLQAASAFGIPSVFATWGYGDAALGMQATRVAQRFDELPDLLHELVPRI